MVSPSHRTLDWKSEPMTSSQDRSEPSEILVDFVTHARTSMTLVDLSEQDLPLVAVSDVFTKMTGYDRDEALGRNCRFLQGELREQRAREEIRRFMLSDRRMHLRTQIVNFRKDGSAFINLLMLAKLTDRRGGARFVLGSQFDIGAAAVGGLDIYETELDADLREMDELTGEHRFLVHGSLTTIANAAAQIAQAKIRLGTL